MAAVALAVVAVWRLGLLDEPIKEVTLPLRHEDIIRQQAADKGVEAELIAAVIYAESRFVDQTSHADARGLMQVTPDTANGIEQRSGGTTFDPETDLSDPQINIQYGTFYLDELLTTYGGNEVAALAAYNAGPGNADAWGGSELEVEDIQFDGDPPIRPARAVKARRVRQELREGTGPGLARTSQTPSLFGGVHGRSVRSR